VNRPAMACSRGACSRRPDALTAEQVALMSGRHPNDSVDIRRFLLRSSPPISGIAANRDGWLSTCSPRFARWRA